MTDTVKCPGCPLCDQRFPFDFAKIEEQITCDGSGKIEVLPPKEEKNIDCPGCCQGTCSLDAAANCQGANQCLCRVHCDGTGKNPRRKCCCCRCDPSMGVSVQQTSVCQEHCDGSGYIRVDEKGLSISEFEHCIL